MECIEKNKSEILESLNKMDSETLVSELREARRKAVEIILFQHTQISELKSKGITAKDEPLESLTDGAAAIDVEELSERVEEALVVEEIPPIGEDELAQLVKEAKENHEEALVVVNIPELVAEYDFAEDLGFDEQEADLYVLNKDSTVVGSEPVLELINEDDVNDLLAQYDVAKKKKKEDDKVERERIKAQGLTKPENKNKKRPSKEEVAVSLVDEDDVDEINNYIQSLKDERMKENSHTPATEEENGALDQSEIDALLGGGDSGDDSDDGGLEHIDY